MQTRHWFGLLDRDDVLILDTETTGLDHRAEVIEVAVVDTTGDLRFESLVMPVGPVPSSLSAIHGITRSLLEETGAPAWPEVHGKLSALLADACEVLAWNAPFDRRMLRQTANRHGLDWGAIAWRDLCAEDNRARPHGSHRLVDVAAREGVYGEGPAHRAQADCRMALAVMRAVVRRWC